VRAPALICSALLCACSETPTQLVVVVDSDYPRAELTCVGVTVRDTASSGTAFAPIDVVATPAEGRVTIPFSIGVLPPRNGNARSSVRIEVRGYGAGGCPLEVDDIGTPLVSRIAQTGFLRHARLRLPMFLARACESMWESCEAAGQTCDPCPRGDCTAPGCVSTEVSVETLARVRREGDELGDGGADAAGPPGPFGPPAPVAEVNSAATERSPSCTDDLLELYFFSDRELSGPRAWLSTRGDTGAPWSGPVLVPGLEGTDVRSVFVAGDGLTLVLAVPGPGGPWQLQTTTRAAVGDRWPEPTPVDDLNEDGSEQSGGETFLDDAFIVFHSNRTGAGMGNADLYQSERSAPGWTVPMRLATLSTVWNEFDPTLTEDGLTIFFESDEDGDTNIWTAGRGDPRVQFEAATIVSELMTAGFDGEPWVSADGRTMLFIRGPPSGPYDIWQASR
jgi:hypothetical protein